MTIQQVITNEQEINQLVLSGKMMDAFLKFYGEDVTMTESDGTTNVGKVACQAYEEGFMASIVEVKDAKLHSSVAMVSPLPEFEFLVVATWFNDIVTNEYAITGNQTSFTYWKDGAIQKVTFHSPTEVIA